MLSGKTKGYVGLPLGCFYFVQSHDLRRGHISRSCSPRHGPGFIVKSKMKHCRNKHFKKIKFRSKPPLYILQGAVHILIRGFHICRCRIGGFNQKKLQVLLTVLYRLLYSSDVYV